MQQPKPILSDFKQLKLVAKVFGDYHKIKFPNDLRRTDRGGKRIIEGKPVSDYILQFITLALFVFDPKILNNECPDRMKQGLRKNISKIAKTNPSLISQFLPRARFYLKVFPTFAYEVQQMLNQVKKQSKK